MSDELRCEICNITYKDRTGLWKHNRKYHVNNTTNTLQKKQHIVQSDIQYQQHDIHHDIQNVKSNICKSCNKVLSNSQSRWRHEKTCKIKKISENENTMLKEKLDILIKHQDNLEKKIEKLESSIIKSAPSNNTNNAHSHNKTVNSNLGTVNNAKVIHNNNINIVAPGNEKNDLTKEEIISIFEKQLTSVIRYIELTNFNKNRPMNHSFCVTNRDGKHMLKYNVDNKSVESDKKKYFYMSVLTRAIARMEMVFNDNKKLINKQFDKEKQEQIKDSIMRLKDICNKNYNDKILKGLYDELNLLCYNSRKTILSTWDKSEDEKAKEPEKELEKDDSDNTEDYKNIFLPMKDFLEIYSNDVIKENEMVYTSSDDDDEETASYIPQLNIKKVQKKKEIDL
jgi:hypothetical protein